MELRKANESEIDCVMDILLDGKESLRRQGLDQWQGKGYPARAIVAADVANGVSYVIESPQGHLAATCMISFDGEADYDEIDGAWLTSGTSKSPTYAVMHRVAVAADSTGRGFARCLLEEGLRIAHQGGAESLRVDTHPGNAPMLSLLRSSGFSECGIIRIKHADGGVPERIAFEQMVR